MSTFILTILLIAKRCLHFHGKKKCHSKLLPKGSNIYNCPGGFFREIARTSYLLVIRKNAIANQSLGGQEYNYYDFLAFAWPFHLRKAFMVTLQSTKD